MRPNEQELMSSIHKAVEEVINYYEGMEKHFSHENDYRNYRERWNITRPHDELGVVQRPHGTRPGKRRVMTGLRAAARLNPNAGIPSWNEMLRMSHSEVMQLGEKHFGGNFQSEMSAMPGGAQVNPTVSQVVAGKKGQRAQIPGK